MHREAPASNERELRIATEITRLCSHWGRHSLQVELATGKAIIDGLHHCSVDAWRKRRKPHPSLRKISDLLGRIRSPSQLYNATCAYALTKQHPGVLSLKHLKPGHLHAVAGLPDDQAVELLRQGFCEHLSVRKLRAMAARFRTRGKGGRPRTPDELRQLREASRLELPPCSDTAPLLKSVAPADQLKLESELLRSGWGCVEHSLGIAHHRGEPRHLFVIEGNGDETWWRTIENSLNQPGYTVRSVVTNAAAWVTRVVLERDYSSTLEDVQET